MVNVTDRLGFVYASAVAPKDASEDLGEGLRNVVENLYDIGSTTHKYQSDSHQKLTGYGYAVLQRYTLSFI